MSNTNSDSASKRNYSINYQNTMSLNKSNNYNQQNLQQQQQQPIDIPPFNQYVKQIVSDLQQQQQSLQGGQMSQVILQNCPATYMEKYYPLYKYQQPVVYSQAIIQYQNELNKVISENSFLRKQQQLYQQQQQQQQQLQQQQQQQQQMAIENQFFLSNHQFQLQQPFLPNQSGLILQPYNLQTSMINQNLSLLQPQLNNVPFYSNFNSQQQVGKGYQQNMNSSWQQFSNGNQWQNQNKKAYLSNSYFQKDNMKQNRENYQKFGKDGQDDGEISDEVPLINENRFNNKEEIQKWIEQRKKNYPTKKRAEEKEQQKKIKEKEIQIPQEQNGQISELEKKLRKKIDIMRQDVKGIEIQQRHLKLIRLMYQTGQKSYSHQLIKKKIEIQKKLQQINNIHFESQNKAKAQQLLKKVKKIKKSLDELRQKVAANHKRISEQYIEKEKEKQLIQKVSKEKQNDNAQTFTENAHPKIEKQEQNSFSNQKNSEKIASSEESEEPTQVQMISHKAEQQQFEHQIEAHQKVSKKKQKQREKQVIQNQKEVVVNKQSGEDKQQSIANKMIKQIKEKSQQYNEQLKNSFDYKYNQAKFSYSTNWLLTHMLQDEMYEERQIILRLIRYIVHNDFFDNLTEDDLQKEEQSVDQQKTPEKLQQQQQNLIKNVLVQEPSKSTPENKILDPISDKLIDLQQKKILEPIQQKSLDQIQKKLEGEEKNKEQSFDKKLEKIISPMKILEPSNIIQPSLLQFKILDPIDFTKKTN